MSEGTLINNPFNAHNFGTVFLSLYETTEEAYDAYMWEGKELTEGVNTKAIGGAMVNRQEILQLFANNDENDDLKKLLTSENPEPKKVYFITVDQEPEGVTPFALPLHPIEMPEFPEDEEDDVAEEPEQEHPIHQNDPER